MLPGASIANPIDATSSPASPPQQPASRRPKTSTARGPSMHPDVRSRREKAYMDEVLRQVVHDAHAVLSNSAEEINYDYTEEKLLQYVYEFFKGTAHAPSFCADYITAIWDKVDPERIVDPIPVPENLLTLQHAADGASYPLFQGTLLPFSAPSDKKKQPPKKKSKPAAAAAAPKKKKQADDSESSSSSDSDTAAEGETDRKRKHRSHKHHRRHHRSSSRQAPAKKAKAETDAEEDPVTVAPPPPAAIVAAETVAAAAAAAAALPPMTADERTLASAECMCAQSEVQLQQAQRDVETVQTQNNALALQVRARIAELEAEIVAQRTREADAVARLGMARHQQQECREAHEHNLQLLARVQAMPAHECSFCHNQRKHVNRVNDTCDHVACAECHVRIVDQALDAADASGDRRALALCPECARLSPAEMASYERNFFDGQPLTRALVNPHAMGHAVPVAAHFALDPCCLLETGDAYRLPHVSEETHRAYVRLANFQLMRISFLTDSRAPSSVAAPCPVCGYDTFGLTNSRLMTSRCRNINCLTIFCRRCNDLYGDNHVCARAVPLPDQLALQAQQTAPAPAAPAPLVESSPGLSDEDFNALVGGDFPPESQELLGEPLLSQMPTSFVVQDLPKAIEPPAKVEEPKAAEPVVEQPTKAIEPVVEPKAAEPVVEQPAKAIEPKVAELVVEQPAKPVVEESAKMEEPKAVVEQPAKAEEPKVEQTKPVVEEPTKAAEPVKLTKEILESEEEPIVQPPVLSDEDSDDEEGEDEKKKPATKAAAKKRKAPATRRGGRRQQK